jgi:hypothetical protein
LKPQIQSIQIYVLCSGTIEMQNLGLAGISLLTEESNTRHNLSIVLGD